MSRNKKDYSDYISYASNLLLVLTLCGGFTFAAITILITQLPDPSTVIVQITLFFLAVMLDLFMFESFYMLAAILHCVEDVPPKTKIPWSPAVNLLIPLSLMSWGIAVWLMFLFWNLVYLALASFIVHMLFDIWGAFTILKPNLEHLKKMRSRE